MADYELKDGNGTAFKNKRKSETKHPDFSGEVKLQGKLHFLDVWVKQTKAGDNYFSIRVGNEKRPKESSDDYQRPIDKPVMDNTRAGRSIDLDDSVPFKFQWK